MWGERPRPPFLLFLLRARLCVLAPETLDATGCVHQFLFAGKERVATRTDFNMDVAAVCGPRGECIAARAMHVHFIICGMNGCLHWFSKSLLNHLILKDALGIQQTGGRRLHLQLAISIWPKLVLLGAAIYQLLSANYQGALPSVQ